MWVAGLVAAFAQVAWASRRAALFQDDFIFLGQARIDGVRDGAVVPTRLSWDYLSSALFEHFSPVARFLFWVLGQSSDPRLLGRVMVLALVGVVIVSFGELTRTVLGRTVPALLITMIASQALVLTRLAAWTTAAFNILPAVACAAFSLALAYRYLHDPGRRAAAVGSVVLYGVAVLDYEFAMLLPLFIGVWFLMCVAPQLGRSETIARLRTTAVYWVLLGVIGAAAALNYRLNYYFDELPRGTVGSSLRTLWYSLFQGLFPAILGVYTPTVGRYSVATVVVCVAWIAIVAVAVLLGRWAAVWALAFGAFSWFVCNGLLAYGRSAVNGIGVAMELYYAAFPLLLLVLAAGETVKSAVLGDPPLATDHVGHDLIGRVRSSAQGIVVGALAVATVASAVGLQIHGDTLTSVRGVARFSGDFAAEFLDDVEAADTPLHVLSAPVPAGVVFSIFYPYDWASRNVGALTEDVEWNSVGDGPLYRIDGLGNLVPVELTTVYEFDIASAVFADGAILDANGCVSFSSPSSVVRLTPADPLRDLALALRLRGTTDRATTMTPYLQTADGMSQDLTGDIVEIAAGSFDSVLRMSAETAAAIELRGLAPGTTLCLDELFGVMVVDA